MKWHADLELDCREVDDEHRQMFEEFYQLSVACEVGEERGAILTRVKNLREHALYHFATEECLMTRHSYPGVEDQRRHHAWLLRDIDDLAARIMQDGPSLELALTVRGKLIRWLIQHIKDVDRQMMDYITKQPAAVTAAS